jgi:hypothetical protein
MNQLLSMIRGVILLDTATYERLRDRKDSMKRGVLILVVCFLIAGSSVFLVNLVNNLRPFGAEQADEVRQQIEQTFEQFQPFMQQGGEFSQIFMDQFMENFESGLQMGAAIDSIKTPLPRGFTALLTSTGAWVTQVFAHLAAWLAYGLWVLLFAKLMGGNGGVDRFFGVTALYAIPHVLGIFSPIYCIGGLIGLVGWIWGVLIYVKSVQVTQRFSTGKAIVATILPALIVFIVVAFFSLLGLLGIIASAGQQ